MAAVFFSNALRTRAAADAEVLDGVLAAGALGRQPIAQRLELLLHELLERRQAFLHVVFQLAGFLDKALFQPREALVVVAHLDAEEDVADLVDAGAAGQCVGGDIGLALSGYLLSWGPSEGRDYHRHAAP